MLPFTTTEFFDVFEQYNRAVWPAQVVLYGTGLLAIDFAIRKRRFADSAIAVILAGLWLWMGIVYHVLFFSAINRAAIAFGIALVVEGLLFAHAGLVKSRLSFTIDKNWATAFGACVLLYALLIYHFLGLAFGHSYPRQPTFGVPCPTTIFTFGILLWTNRRVSAYLLVIPTLWAMIGSSAALLFGVWEDLGLIVAGTAGAVVIWQK